MSANSSPITTCGPNATVSSSVSGRVYRPAGLADTTLVRPTRRSLIRPACERRLTSRWMVVNGVPSFADSSVMLYSVSGWRRSTVRSSACGWDRRIGMRAGASARIDGRYHPFKGRVNAAAGRRPVRASQSLGSRHADCDPPVNPATPAAWCNGSEDRRRLPELFDVLFGRPKLCPPELFEGSRCGSVLAPALTLELEFMPGHQRREPSTRPYFEGLPLSAAERCPRCHRDRDVPIACCADCLTRDSACACGAWGSQRR